MLALFSEVTKVHSIAYRHRLNICYDENTDMPLEEITAEVWEAAQKEEKEPVSHIATLFATSKEKYLPLKIKKACYYFVT